ncbi:MAG TPA: hypothetical protein VFY23_09605 [Candidatus Limnocylindrales bacterium]|nr:hypothetical protein [Candidatus Limnocylindrales bacterium]
MTMQPPRAPSGPPKKPAQAPQEPLAPPPSPPERFRGSTTEPFETREIRKARERADRASRRADRAARRVRDAEERAGTAPAGTRQWIDVAGDAATAALTAVSAAADEAQAKLAAKARMRELEHAVVTARAGGRVEVAPPTREEALTLADRVDPGSAGATFVRAMGFILAFVAIVVMALVGGFGWLGVGVPLAVLVAGVSVGNRIEIAERGRKAARIQLELAGAGPAGGRLPAGGATQQLGQGAGPAGALTAASVATTPGAARPSLREAGDPRTRSEILARLDRLIPRVGGLVPQTNVAVLGRIRDSAARALPASDAPLDLADHDTWLLRQICVDYLPGALEHYIALPPERASEPVLDGRSAREVLDEQLALIERRLDQIATRAYQRQAGGLLTHARFVADVLRPDPFQARLAELAATGPDPAGVGAVPDPALVTAGEPVQGSGTSTTMDPAARRDA